MKREFTYYSKTNLLYYIDLISHKPCSISSPGNMSAAGVDVSDAVSMVDSYYKAVVDKNSATKNDIIKIFDNVEMVDKRYSVKIDGQCTELSHCRDYILKLASIMGRSTNVDSPNFNINNIQNTMSLALTAIYADRLCSATTDEYGNRIYEYDFEKIREILQGSREDVPDDLCAALISVFISMEKPEDIEQFINSGYNLNPDPDSFNPGVIGYVTYNNAETDTMKFITQTMTDSISALAFSTIWKDPGKFGDNKYINACIDHMQMLQICEELAKKNIQGTTHNTPPRMYGELKSVTLGSPLMTGPEDAWKDRQFSYVNYMNDGSLAESIGSEMLGAARDKTLETILAGSGLLAEGAAGWASAGIGIVINVVDDYIDRMNKLKESEAYLAETENYYNLIKLGGKICYTEVNDVIVVHGIDLQNPEVVKRTTGYVNNNGFGVDSPEEVIRIVLEGDENNQIYQDYLLFIKLNF